MKYIDTEKLKAEIERYENTAIDAYNPQGEDADFWYGKVVVCEDLKTLITSLQQEQPGLPGVEESGVPGKDYIPIEWVDACEKYGKWKIVKQEQPETDLEKEVMRFVSDDKILSRLVKYDDALLIAHHFAEWGAIHLNARKEETK